MSDRDLIINEQYWQLAATEDRYEDELVYMFDERELRRRLRREYELGRIEGSVIGFIAGTAVAVTMTTIAVLGLL